MTNGELDTTGGARVQMSLIYSRPKQFNSKNMFAKYDIFELILLFIIN
ncbi:hypothetical protein [Psychrobacter sp. JCM 18903]|nr:hypothetical protein [Psychrobacter sp. JCM 18903]